LRFCAAARKVSVPVGVAAAVEEAFAVPGEEASAVPGADAGVLGAAVELVGATTVVGVLTGPGVLEAELVEELQAVNSREIPASDAQAATCRGLGAFVIPMVSNLPINGSRLGEPRHSYDAGCSAVVGISLMLGCYQGPFGTTWVFSRSTGLRRGRWERG
jgi:hypothetical protein